MARKKKIVEHTNNIIKRRPSWKGCGDISGSIFGFIRINAKDRNLEFSITIEYIWNLFLKQNKKCAITNKTLYFDKKNKTASLDRIDSSKGYIEGNVQWVHKDINLMKHKLSMKELIDLCQLVVDHNQLKDISNVSK